MKYIVLPSVEAKIKEAIETKSHVMISASTGWGKSALLSHYYKENACYLLQEDGKLKEMPDARQVAQTYIVIDDFAMITDAESRAYIVQLLQQSERQVVLSGRSEFPQWLSLVIPNIPLVRIWEKDLTWKVDEIRSFFDGMLLEKEYEFLAEITHGYPIAVRIYAQQIEAGRQLDETVVAEVWEYVFNFLMQSAFGKLSARVQELLFHMCYFERFDIALAENVLGTQDAAACIDECRDVGNFLYKIDKNYYSIRTEARETLLWHNMRAFSSEYIEGIYERGGAYYAQKDKWIDAVALYKKAKNQEKIIEILERNAGYNPGDGLYYELRDYYKELPEEVVCRSPALMAAMSMLYALLLEPEKSEQWYDKLMQLEKDMTVDAAVRKEARTRRVYLDVALPHRPSKGIIGILKSAATMSSKGEIELPEFAVTGNQPSLMNGGIDFSDWSKIDKQLSFFMSKPIEIVLGKSAKGLVDIAMAESGFEKGTMNSYEVLTRLNNGFLLAEGGGKLEICFAAAGVIVKQHILCGQLDAAMRLMESMQRKLEQAKADKLLKNLEAVQVGCELYENSKAVATKYLQVCPDETIVFFTMDRLQYLMKLRCLIAVGNLAQALVLSGRLEEYFAGYNRVICLIETYLMQAIILYRMEDERYMEVLEKALFKAQEYHFVRLISLFGAAIFPLLQEVRRDTKVKKAFFASVLDETRLVARQYPEYLYYEPDRKVELTDQETRILMYLCQGMQLQKIAEVCGIKYNSVKVHSHNIYQKLGVSSRSEAEKAAMRLGLVGRKREEERI